MLIKVCGMREPENIRAIEEAGADLVGFILTQQSPRYVAEPPDPLPRRSRRVGVFLDQPIPTIIREVQRFQLHYVQLHGHETTDDIDRLRAQLPPDVSIIKAVAISTPDDLAHSARYEGHADLLLFDTPHSKASTSHPFDWQQLHLYRGTLPFLLAGAIGPDSIPQLQALHHPRLIGFDINSRFETRPAFKDPQLVTQFIQNIKQP